MMEQNNSEIFCHFGLHTPKDFFLLDCIEHFIKWMKGRLEGH